MVDAALRCHGAEKRRVPGVVGPMALVPVATLLLSVISHPSAAQPPSDARGQVENLQVNHQPGGAVEVVFDLQAATPDVRFDVTLEVSQDGGTTFDMTANTVSGDVGIGVPIAPGAEKRIVWQSGHDLERIDIENLRFRIVLVPWPRLIVLTDPSGVSVSVDGTGRGETPLAVADLPPGDHAVILTLDGFLENSQVVTLTSGEEETVQVTLTSAGASQPVVESEEGGSNRLVLILAGVGGAVGAVALAGGGGEPAASGGVAVSGADPIGRRELRVLKSGSGSGRVTSNPPGINCGNDCVENFPQGTFVTLTATPDTDSSFEGWSGDLDCSDGRVTMTIDRSCTASFARENRPPVAVLTISTSGGVPPLAALTLVRFDGSGSSDPDGDNLTFTWQFGDGRTATGSVVSTSYITEEPLTVFTVTLTVRDEWDAYMDASSTVTVKSMTGIWSGTDEGGSRRTFDIRQSGLTLTGTYTNSNLPGVGSFQGELAQPRNITFEAVTDSPIRMTNAPISADGDSFTGDLTRDNGLRTPNQTFRRQ